MPIQILTNTRLLVSFGNHRQLGICTAGGADSMKTKHQYQPILIPILNNARLLVSFGNHRQQGICSVGDVDLLKTKYETVPTIIPIQGFLSTLETTVDRASAQLEAWIH